MSSTPSRRTKFSRPIFSLHDRRILFLVETFDDWYRFWRLFEKMLPHRLSYDERHNNQIREFLKEQASGFYALDEDGQFVAVQNADTAFYLRTWFDARIAVLQIERN